MAAWARRLSPGRGVGFGSRHERRSLVGWSATALLLVSTLALTIHTQRRAADAHRAFGTLVPVWVATRDLEAGQQVRTSDAEIRRLPRAVLTDAAIADDVTGRTVLAATLAGEVIVERRLASGTGAAALLPEGSVGLAIRVELAPPGVVAGDEVALVVADRGIDVTGRPPGVIVHGQAISIDLEHDQLVVGVAAADAPLVAAALLRGELLVGSLRVPTRSTG